MKKFFRTRKLAKLQTSRQREKSKRFKRFCQPTDRQKPIKHKSDFQINWAAVIPELMKRSIISVEKPSKYSISGDAPKDFITDREDQIIERSAKIPIASYIAKVGSKDYPNESIVEQFLTRIGQCYEIDIAGSKLRMVAGQVRFMSKYFLGKGEGLTHGAEILARKFGREAYKKIEEKKIERKHISIQFVFDAIVDAFPDNKNEIIAGFIEMHTFDALIGHNDRHPSNWGVVVPFAKEFPPKFSPIYDTARALFWNEDEAYCLQAIRDKDHTLKGYVRKCKSKYNWNGDEKIDFCEMIGLLWKEYKLFRGSIEIFLPIAPLEKCIQILDTEFSRLMSAERRELIKRCLRLRHKLLSEAVAKFSERREENNDSQISSSR